MALSKDIEVDGVTAFESPPSASYRYVLTLKDDKLSIWIEDRASKQQWLQLHAHKGGMEKADYVSSVNAIPGASASDYVKCLQDSLECDLGDDSDVQRKLTALKGGARRLELAMSIDFIRSSWVAKFTFDLDPVSVERIDVLESKLRDQQEELERLRGMVDGVDTPLFVKLEATTKTKYSSIGWGKIKSDDFIVAGNDGVVKVVRPGLYHVTSSVNCAPNGHNQLVRLLKNEECILWCYCGYASGNCASTVLDTIVRVENNDDLTITCDCNVSGTSYLTLARLAK